MPVGKHIWTDRIPSEKVVGKSMRREIDGCRKVFTERFYTRVHTHTNTREGNERQGKAREAN